jgi:hypothetical protein
MQLNLFGWIKISIFNLLIVSVLGICLRYKILYSLPIVDQKHLLHSHSHFAFTGWITQTLMVLIVAFLSNKLDKDLFKKYHFLLVLNLIAAWGMLITFIIQGYGLFSITFSTISIFISYVFAIIVWKDLNKIINEEVSVLWLKVALLSSAISSLGAFALAFMMATKTIHQNWYLSAQYFFLHFQYNGWFFFTCMGLLTSHYLKNSIELQKLKLIFYLFAFALVPAFFLSVLWMKLPLVIYIFIVLAATAQVVSWFFLLYQVKNNLSSIKSKLQNKLIAQLLAFVIVALTIKIFLQFGSIHPVLSDLAFGFRPIVIGYLHLVLLGIISLSILIYVLSLNIFDENNLIKKGAFFFAIYIIVNEILLMIQGIAALDYIIIPYINEALFITAIFLFLSITILLRGILKAKMTSVINL